MSDCYGVFLGSCIQKIQNVLCSSALSYDILINMFFSRSALTFGANNKDKVKCLKKISWKLWTLNCWKKTYNILSSFGRRNICDVAMLCLQKWLKSAQPPADMQRGMVHCHFEWRLHTWLQSQANCHFFASALANSRKKSKASYIMCIFFFKY